MTESQKNWIDNANYEQLLSKWRFAAIGDPMFQGETGKYYQEVMSRKRAENPDEHVAASKSVGW